MRYLPGVPSVVQKVAVATASPDAARGMVGMSRAIAALAVLTLLAVAGCSLAGPSVTSNKDAELRQSLAFRERFGLNTDVEWVRSVLADPDAHAAVAEFSVPLTSGEATELRGRVRAADELWSVVDRYGQGEPATYAGAYSEASGRVVALFANDLDSHEARIWAAVHPSADLVLRQARWTLAELRTIEARLTKDRPLLEAEGVRVEAAGIRPSLNALEVEVASERSGLQAYFDDRYGRSAVSLTVRPVQPQIPPGVIDGVAIDPGGHPVADLLVRPTDRAKDFGEVGISTAEDGSFLVERAHAGTYSISLDRQIGDGIWEEVGTAIVTVPPGGRVQVAIVVEGGA